MRAIITVLILLSLSSIEIIGQIKNNYNNEITPIGAAYYKQTETPPKKKKLRAVTYPIGTVTVASLTDSPDTKTYRVQTAVFTEKTAMVAFQSDHEAFNTKITNHTIGGQEYKKRESGIFDIIIGKEENNDLKVFISFPGFFMGKLSFKKEKDNVIKYKYFKKSNETRKDIKIPAVIFYEDDKQGTMEQKLKKFDLLSPDMNTPAEKSIYTELKTYYLIYYTFPTI